MSKAAYLATDSAGGQRLASSGSRASCAALALSLALGTGCIYRSKVEEREIRTPEHYQRLEKRAKVARAKLGRWWKVFRDPQLDGLVELAFAHSPDLEITRARIAQARARVMGATAGWYPSISGSLQASRTQSAFNLPDSLGGGVRKVKATIIEASLSASYEIDLWGRVRYARKAAKHTLQASEEDLRAAYITIAANVTDAYYLLVQQREQLELVRQTIDNRAKQLDLVRERYRAGVARPSDLYQAQQNLAQAQTREATIGGTLRTAEHALAILVGRFPGEIEGGKLDMLPKPIAQVDTGLPADLLFQRPDLRAAHQRLLAVDARVGAALAQHFPNISIGASIGSRIDPMALIWNLFANLAAPLFQGGRIHAQYRENKALLREALAGFKQQLLVAVKEVEDALVMGQAIQERIARLEQLVTASEGALRLSVDQYVQGLSGYLNVLAAEQTLLTSRLDLIAARRELITARISLARAIGGSWMDKEIERHARDPKGNAGEAPATSKTQQGKG
jgi:NodT family efflux transporter outer membrane factor (OMF) lipoprotein